MANRYENIEVVKSPLGRRYYKNNFYPQILPLDSDIYVIATEEDRYDILAVEYYRDKTLWWIIPTANSLDCMSLKPDPGIQLRIPTDLVEILDQYNSLNRF